MKPGEYYVRVEYLTEARSIEELGSIVDKNLAKALYKIDSTNSYLDINSIRVDLIRALNDKNLYPSDKYFAYALLDGNLYRIFLKRKYNGINTQDMQNNNFDVIADIKLIPKSRVLTDTACKLIVDGVNGRFTDTDTVQFKRNILGFVSIDNFIINTAKDSSLKHFWSDSEQNTPETMRLAELLHGFILNFLVPQVICFYGIYTEKSISKLYNYKITMAMEYEDIQDMEKLGYHQYKYNNECLTTRAIADLKGDFMVIDYCGEVPTVITSPSPNNDPEPTEKNICRMS